jgi:hypothetical protein
MLLFFATCFNLAKMFFDSSTDLRSIKPRLNGDNAGVLRKFAGYQLDVSLFKRLGCGFFCV